MPKSFPLEYSYYEKHKQFEGEFLARCRVKGVFAAILRDAALECSNLCSFIIVSHGVTIHSFRMQWMHYHRK